MNTDLYNMIFKRKSFHLFKNIGGGISLSEIDDIKEAYNTFKPLCPDIKTQIKIVTADKTTCNRGQEYCILLYSEKKDNYLQNVGYLGEQLDLFLVSRNIGTLWFGIGKADEPLLNGLEFVIMIAISKVSDNKNFRRDMYKSKRKPVEEIWVGEQIRGVTDTIRFAPSACNSQPWIVEREGNILTVYRYKKPGKRGIMPYGKVSYYNRIDMGIFLCFLDLCLEHYNIRYDAKILRDGAAELEKTPAAVYKML